MHDLQAVLKGPVELRAANWQLAGYFQMRFRALSLEVEKGIQAGNIDGILQAYRRCFDRRHALKPLIPRFLRLALQVWPLFQHP